MDEPLAVALKFGFLAVLYLFLLWVARSALKDMTRHSDTAVPGEPVPDGVLPGVPESGGLLGAMAPALAGKPHRTPACENPGPSRHSASSSRVSAFARV